MPGLVRVLADQDPADVGQHQEQQPANSNRALPAAAGRLADREQIRSGRREHRPAQNAHRVGQPGQGARRLGRLGRQRRVAPGVQMSVQEADADFHQRHRPAREPRQRQQPHGHADRSQGDNMPVSLRSPGERRQQQSDHRQRRQAHPEQQPGQQRAARHGPRPSTLNDGAIRLGDRNQPAQQQRHEVGAESVRQRRRVGQPQARQRCIQASGQQGDGLAGQRSQRRVQDRDRQGPDHDARKGQGHRRRQPQLVRQPGERQIDRVAGEVGPVREQIEVLQTESEVDGVVVFGPARQEWQTQRQIAQRQQPTCVCGSPGRCRRRRGHLGLC